jgi:hypothetical protein
MKHCRIDGGTDWIHLAQGKNTVIIIRVAYNAGDFGVVEQLLASQEGLSFLQLFDASKHRLF